MRVDQVIPSLASRDAIGVHTLAVSEALRDAGIESQIYYGNATPDVAQLGRPVTELGRSIKDRWLLYQSSIGSTVFDILFARSEPKLVNYHNITPVRFIEPWEPDVGYEVSLGRSQLARLAQGCALAIADSSYNEGELREAGYRTTAVVPLLIEMVGHVEEDKKVSEELAADKTGGGVDMLFVGKVSPHKAPHDLVKMLSIYHKLYDPRARLHLVGSPLGDRYIKALESYISDLGLDTAVSITGSLTPAELEAYYNSADVFVCASNHEGFCVPIVEAMGHGVPVVAFATAAIPETVGGAGLVLPDKSPLKFAAAVNRVLTDKVLNKRLSNAAATRVADFSLERSTRNFVDLVKDAIGA